MNGEVNGSETSPTIANTEHDLQERFPATTEGMEISDSAEPDLDWKAGKEEWAIIIVLAVVSLMVALDATILVTALPVSGNDMDGLSNVRLIDPVHSYESSWECNRYLLDGYSLPAHPSCLPAIHHRSV